MPSLGLRIFVSHSHADNDFGVKLVQSLRRAYGEDVVWYDSQEGLYGGDNWWHKILKELTEREVFIVVLSPDAVKSRWVNDEITMAWNQKNSSTGKTIIPILLRDCKIRPDLKTLQSISFQPPDTYDKAFYDLMRALEAKFPIPRRTTRSLSSRPSTTFRKQTQSLFPLSSTTFRRQTQSLSPPPSRSYSRRSAQSLPTTPSVAQKRQKKSSQRRLYYYENTAQVRRTPYFYDDTPFYEDRPLVDVPVDLRLEPESDKLPVVRRAPYSFVDDPLQQELAQQIDVPVIRRSSRLAAAQYGEDGDDYFLAPEQIDKELSVLHTDEHPEIPRVRRASAHSIVPIRRRKAVRRRYIHSLPALMLRNKRLAYFSIGIMLFVMILAMVFFAPVLSGIVLLILLVLAISALLAVGYLYSNDRKK
jgi:hypothetical protein